MPTRPSPCPMSLDPIRCSHAPLRPSRFFSAKSGVRRGQIMKERDQARYKGRGADAGCPDWTELRQRETIARPSRPVQVRSIQSVLPKLLSSLRPSSASGSAAVSDPAVKAALTTTLGPALGGLLAGDKWLAKRMLELSSDEQPGPPGGEAARSSAGARRRRPHPPVCSPTRRRQRASQCRPLWPRHHSQRVSSRRHHR